MNRRVLRFMYAGVAGFAAFCAMVDYQEAHAYSRRVIQDMFFGVLWLLLAVFSPYLPTLGKPLFQRRPKPLRKP